MDNNTSSVAPFKPVELLMEKSVKRFFSAKNRGKNLISYGVLYIAFLKFYKKVNDLYDEISKGMVDNGIIESPRSTLYLRDQEIKIEAILAEISEDMDMTDIETSDLVVYEVSKMTIEDFSFINKQK